MALINYATREINAKIVFYGPGLSGKTTNIQHVFNKVKPGNKGKLISLATQGDRTLFFDFLPVELGNIKGFKTRFHLYTVPGQVFYNSTRKMVLKGSDGVVFVADSQKMMMDENIQSLENLRDNLRGMGLSFDKFPVVLQYNKRDLPNAAPVEELNDALNPGHLPYFEASAINGDGVLKTLTSIVKYVLNDLKDMPSSTSMEFPRPVDLMMAEPDEEEAPVTAPELAAALQEPVSEPEPVDEPLVHAAVSALEAEPSEQPSLADADVTPAPVAQADSSQLTREEIFTFGRLVDEGVSGTDVSGGDIEIMEAEAVAEGDEVMELPEASPDLFGAFGGIVSGEEVYDAVEVPEGLGDSIADTKSEHITERISLPDDAPVEFTGDEIAAFSSMAENVPDEVEEPDIPEDFVYGTQAAYGPPVETFADIEPEPARASVRAKGRFRLPVRLTTPDGVKEVILSLNVDVELEGEGMESVSGVELMTPLPVDRSLPVDLSLPVDGPQPVKKPASRTETNPEAKAETITDTNPPEKKSEPPATQHKGDSMHPPPFQGLPERNQQSRPPLPSEPRFNVRKAGVLERMFGR